ncbi:MAG: hypothetical protein NZZ41_08140 [Candidatus Dojkabacteria bacterium]|nr:hypothetical protein [Candidatus Dojkabacteria bacterium]
MNDEEIDFEKIIENNNEDNDNNEINKPKELVEREILYNKFMKKLKELINISNIILIKPTWLINEINKYKDEEQQEFGFYIFGEIIDYSLTDLEAEIEARIYYCQKILNSFPEIYLKLTKFKLN